MTDPIEAHIVWSKLLNHTKNRALGHMLTTMVYVSATCAVRVTTFSAGGNSDLFRLYGVTPSYLDASSNALS